MRCRRWRPPPPPPPRVVVEAATAAAARRRRPALATPPGACPHRCGGRPWGEVLRPLRRLLQLGLCRPCVRPLTRRLVLREGRPAPMRPVRLTVPGVSRGPRRGRRRRRQRRSILAVGSRRGAPRQTGAVGWPRRPSTRVVHRRRRGRGGRGGGGEWGRWSTRWWLLGLSCFMSFFSLLRWVVTSCLFIALFQPVLWHDARVLTRGPLWVGAPHTRRWTHASVDQPGSVGRGHVRATPNRLPGRGGVELTPTPRSSRQEPRGTHPCGGPKGTRHPWDKGHPPAVGQGSRALPTRRAPSPPPPPCCPMERPSGRYQRTYTYSFSFLARVVWPTHSKPPPHQGRSVPASAAEHQSPRALTGGRALSTGRRRGSPPHHPSPPPPAATVTAAAQVQPSQSRSAAMAVSRTSSPSYPRTYPSPANAPALTPPPPSRPASQLAAPSQTRVT